MENRSLRILLPLAAALSPLAWGVLPSYGQDQVAVSGITEPIKDVTLSLTVAGTISTISFKEGAQIKRGQVILELDNRLEKLEVKRRKLLWESKAEVESASAQEATLKSQLDSTRKLFESTGSVSKEELEKQELEHALAVAEHKRLMIAEERERIEYEMALQTLDRRRLRSPFQGVIIKLMLKEGETCEERQPLAQVVDTSKCVFKSNVEERIGRTLSKGQSVDLSIRTGSQSAVKKGKIVFASPVVDPASGLLEVKAEFDNRDGEVRPGVAGVLLLKTN
jgi:RND family efflux transporter MFP subunit